MYYITFQYRANKIHRVLRFYVFNHSLYYLQAQTYIFNQKCTSSTQILHLQPQTYIFNHISTISYTFNKKLTSITTSPQAQTYTFKHRRTSSPSQTQRNDQTGQTAKKSALTLDKARSHVVPKALISYSLYLHQTKKSQKHEHGG